jgi:hypothetical protein
MRLMRRPRWCGHSPRPASPSAAVASLRLPVAQSAGLATAAAAAAGVHSNNGDITGRWVRPMAAEGLRWAAAASLVRGNCLMDGCTFFVARNLTANPRAAAPVRPGRRSVNARPESAAPRARLRRRIGDRTHAHRPTRG